MSEFYIDRNAFWDNKDFSPMEVDKVEPGMKVRFVLKRDAKQIAMDIVKSHDLPEEEKLIDVKLLSW